MNVKKSKLVPTRGIVEDWSDEKENEMIEKKKEYSAKMMVQQSLGFPDLKSKYGDILIKKNRKRTIKK
jgi:hypothetical protein